MVDACDTEAELALGLFDTALQVADGPHLAQVDTDGHQRLGDLRGQAGDDHLGAHQPRRVDGPHQRVRDSLVDVRDARDVHDHHLGSVAADATEQLFGQLSRSQLVEDPDHRPHESSSRAQRP